MLIARPADIKSSEITGKSAYLNRRGLIAAAGLAGGAALGLSFIPNTARADALKAVPSPLSTPESPTPKAKITTYNNFYEFGVEKDDPSENAGSLKTAPWSVAIEGECAKPATYALEDILKGETLEDRVYRHRCVERWSMVIPWVGFPLANLLKRVEPNANAKYVAFQTLYDPKQMPGQKDRVLDWPYLEGLRMDEAMHPLTLLAVGLYGEAMPNQDGAPIRLVVPWKYGFKSIKSIVKIKLVAEPAEDRMEHLQPRRIWLLFERQSRARPPALVAEERTPDRRQPAGHADRHPDLQRLWRPGGFAVRRHGPDPVLLMDRRTRERWAYWTVWAGCFLPIPLVVWWFYADELGANPAKEGLHYLGEWALRFLAIGLAITPLRKLFGWGWLLRYRRTIGLFALAYVSLHLIVYIALDQGFDWGEIWRDIVKRPYITFGMLAFLLLLPLAITSTNTMIRKLGARRWRNLHRLVYLIAVLGVLHYDLLVKKDASWPHFYAIVIGLLLAYRLADAVRKHLARRTPAPAAVRRTVSGSAPNPLP